MRRPKEVSLQMGRSDRRIDSLIVRDLREDDAGNYFCVATSSGVFINIEAVSYVEVKARG